MPNKTRDKRKTLNEAQMICARVYGGGDYAYIADEYAKNKKDPWPSINNAGDTLFLFLMRELADTEDCNDLLTAIGRCETAVRDVQTVQHALESA